MSEATDKLEQLRDVMRHVTPAGTPIVAADVYDSLLAFAEQQVKRAEQAEADRKHLLSVKAVLDERLKQQISAYNTGGFADADALAVIPEPPKEGE